jgi:hypothetical protein
VFAILRTSGGGFSFEITSAVLEHHAKLIVTHAGAERQHEIDAGLLRPSRSAEYDAHLLEASSASDISVGMSHPTAFSARHDDNGLSVVQPALNAWNDVWRNVSPPHRGDDDTASLLA